MFVQRRGAYLAGLGGFQAILLVERGVDRHERDGRHHSHVRDGVLLMRPEPVFHLEAGEDVAFLAGAEGGGVRHWGAGGVEHGQGDEADCFVGSRRRFVDESVLCDEVVVGEHGGFGEAGGAGGEEEGGCGVFCGV